VTDIALQEGEQLVGTGPVAAGDTVRWIVGDTESGTPKAPKVHILVKPTRPDLSTNLVINTDRHTYERSFARPRRPTWPRSPGSTRRTSSSRCAGRTHWLTPQPQLRPDSTSTACASATRLNDNPRWRPLRAFDDGRRVYIEFPRGIAQGEMPPLFIVGPQGKTSELVNYRVRGSHIIVDRMFAAAELRLGDGGSQQRVRIVRTDGSLLW
jgi:type IV secretion system protein TrbG